MSRFNDAKFENLVTFFEAKITIYMIQKNFTVLCELTLSNCFP